MPPFDPFFLTITVLKKWYDGGWLFLVLDSAKEWNELSGLLERRSLYSLWLIVRGSAVALEITTERPFY